MKTKNFQKYLLPYEIGRGAEGIVYKISDKYVAKVPRICYPDSKKNLRKEFEIAKVLFENGVSVPEPEGIFKIRNLGLTSVIIPSEAFIMEYIKGKTGSEFFRDYSSFRMVNPNFIESPSFAGYNEEYNHIKKLYEEEIKKAKEIGFLPFDAEFNGNYIWSAERSKLYLIDFGMWEWET